MSRGGRGPGHGSGAGAGDARSPSPPGEPSGCGGGGGGAEDHSPWCLGGRPGSRGPGPAPTVGVVRGVREGPADPGRSRAAEVGPHGEQVREPLCGRRPAPLLHARGVTPQDCQLSCRQKGRRPRAFLRSEGFVSASSVPFIMQANPCKDPGMLLLGTWEPFI